jgi:hypothetical protein
MLRRRPTVILLEDIDSLQLFPLTTDFQKLTLDESYEQSYDDLEFCSTPNTDTDIDLTALSHAKPLNHTSSPSRGIFSCPSPAPPSTSASTKPCAESHLPQESLQNTSPGIKPRRASQSIDPPRSKVTFALSPQENQLHSGRANRPPEGQEGTQFISVHANTTHLIWCQQMVLRISHAQTLTQPYYSTRRSSRHNSPSCRVVSRPVRLPPASHSGT